MSFDLSNIIDVLTSSPQAQEIAESAESYWKGKPFVPASPQQVAAYISKADVLLYGGEPGGGKTALGLGAALNDHQRSLVVRRAFVDLDGVFNTLSNLLEGDTRGLVRGSRPKYTKKDGGIINFYGMGDDLGGKQGNPHDLIYVDEAAQLPEAQVRMLMGWLRTNIKGQRCRMILGSNPPLDSVGDWLIDYFAPWLDPQHPNPAEDGELRWFLPNPNGGKDIECDEGETIELFGKTVGASSRTFIRSSYADNPYYDSAEYAKKLASMTPEAREVLMSGSFVTNRIDPINQLIPTTWIRQAQARWTQRPPEKTPMTSIGVDAVRGGGDKMTIAPRYDGWFAPIIAIDGERITSGDLAAAEVIKVRQNKCQVVVDVVGIGASPVDSLRRNGIDCIAFNGGMKSERRTRDGTLKFYNKRAESWVKFKEALDPDQEGGCSIALPPDPELMADLCSARIKNLDLMAAQGILLEPKEEIKKLIGRSPDKGDAVVLSWNSGALSAPTKKFKPVIRKVA